MREKVYLCGPINGQTDYQAKGWREEAMRLLVPHGFFILDPMDRDYRGKELDNVQEIIDGDLRDIKRCKYILANCLVPSWGTAMEIALSSSMKPRPRVFAFNVHPRPSPWLIGHTDWRGFELKNACDAIVRHSKGTTALEMVN